MGQLIDGEELGNMKWKFLVAVFFMFSQMGAAQVDGEDRTGPRIGLNRLAIKYYGIDFKEEQRKILQGNPIELIFDVDTFGVASLAEVNAVNDDIILDSLQKTTSELDPFFIRVINGEKQAYIYFLKLQYPKYDRNILRYSSIQEVQLFRNASIEDFKSIKYAKSGMDIYFGGVFNSFSNDHLGLGGGMDFDMNYVWNQNNFFGLNMAIHGNKRKKVFNIPSQREQAKYPGAFSIGVHFGRKIRNNSLQAELNWSAINIITKENDHDTQSFQSKGWSTGLVYMRSIPLSKKKPSFLYSSPVIAQHNLALTGAIKYFSMDVEQASGLVFELGVGYLFNMTEVKSYELKPHMYN